MAGLLLGARTAPNKTPRRDARMRPTTWRCHTWAVVSHHRRDKAAMRESMVVCADYTAILFHYQWQEQLAQRVQESPVTAVERVTPAALRPRIGLSSRSAQRVRSAHQVLRTATVICVSFCIILARAINLHGADQQCRQRKCIQVKCDIHATAQTLGLLH